MRNDAELAYRDEPAGVVVGEIDHGRLDWAVSLSVLGV